nr:MAG TPA: hypothetical protein [Caudoviricetes sp.]
MFHVGRLFVNQSFFVNVELLQSVEFVQKVRCEPFVILVGRNRLFGVIDASIFIVWNVNPVKVGSQTIAAPSLDCGTNCIGRFRFRMNNGSVIGVESIAPTDADSERTVELQRNATTIFFFQPFDSGLDFFCKGVGGVGFDSRHNVFLSPVLSRFSGNSNF